MQGTIIRLRPRGAIVTLDGTPEIGDLFEVYRVENNTDIILASGYIRKSKGNNEYKLNPMDKEDGSRGGPFVGVVIGDLVRSVSH